MTVISCLALLHNHWLVALAALVCVSGGWVAFELLRRATLRSGKQRSGWLFLSAVAAGASVWCTHFIAMLAYDAGAPVTYDPILTMLSLMIAIVGAALGLKQALKGRRLSDIGAGIVLGVAFSSMHYSGMLAWHVDGIVDWHAAHVIASILFACVLCAFAIRATRGRHRLLPLALFVAAIVSLHFTGMAAVSVTPLLTGAPIADATVVVAMAVAVAGVAMIIAATGIASYMIDTDVSEQNLHALHRLAMNDGLTGLPNRTSYSNYLDLELQLGKADGRHVAVIGIDLDKFKEINDMRGHEAGDEALKSIASRLLGLTRDREFVARMGGDEFAAVKSFTQQEELHDFLGRLETELFLPLRLDGFEVATGASIGVSVFPQDGTAAARLLSNADLAMYRAKNDVTRVVCFYEAEMDEAARERRALALDLRRAIELQQLQLYYQVQTSVVDRSVRGYEVLLRWAHPERGFVSPAEFIPIAEQTGTILALGEWVLREACREAARWSSGTKIAVNLSPIQLTHSDLPKLVSEILQETGLSPARLELEITESSIIQDKVRSLRALRQIRALGVTIAIDDFGTGYSSLETLRSFPFDRIKLDRTFMMEVEESAQARAVIRAVLALGKSLDISVLAEGVETEEQLQLLRREGCDEAQGFLLGRPQPHAAETSWNLAAVAA